MYILEYFQRYEIYGTSVITLSKTRKTANEASTICTAFGGNLFQIDDLARNFIQPILIQEYTKSMILNWLRHTLQLETVF